MKKRLKIIIFSIVIIYFIFSIGNLIFNYLTYKNILNSIDLSNSNIEKIETESPLSFSELLKLSRLSGTADIIYQQMFLIFISIILGISIGIVYTLKEFSKIRYLLYFILGYIIYTLALFIIAYFSTKDLELNTLSIYSYIANHFLLIYILFFIILLIINFIIGKVQIKKLNNKLNNSKY